ncbi:hypothetical protein ACLD0W_06585 [Alloalcanivorax sp. C16-1]|uniref:hypothetical protein n=1 Tax=Alloalcanivorax sp. C16-1 TaxID=3390051 RepID=UPI003970AF10
MIATIMVITVLVNWLVITIINRLESSKLTTASVDKTALNFAKRLISVVIYGVGIGVCLTHIPELKIVGHSLLTGAGILTLVGGLASQQAMAIMQDEIAKHPLLIDQRTISFAEGARLYALPEDPDEKNAG